MHSPVDVCDGIYNGMRSKASENTLNTNDAVQPKEPAPTVTVAKRPFHRR